MSKRAGQPNRSLVLARRALVPKVLAIFLRVVFGHLRRKAAAAGITGTQVGAISVEQRFGEGARCHWHIQVATRLLRGGASVREAAEQVGYQSEEAFSRTFKRITGQPPVRLRGR